ncbi:MAG: hypothetical protein HY782_13325 [Chloroflexi bacterium]|nr:hypothetical protein [Chloroflexota bacterium]
MRESHVTMISPAPGFTARVMAKIAERERAQARRRVVIGAGLLAVAATALAALIGGALVVIAVVFAANSDVILGSVIALAPFVTTGTALVEALWISVTVVAHNVSAAQVLAYALAVLVLTLVWVRVVAGSSPRLLTLTVGGFRK